jgi:tripartite-type tricarboxylate transporter receptor subunit TctC
MIVRLVLLAAVAMAALGPAAAQTYPDHTVKLVVPFPPGGATDTAGRLVAKRLQEGLGQTVVVENIAGAGGTIGAKQVASAAADGYTLMMAAVAGFGTQPALYKLDYEPIKAFAPVATVVVDKTVLVVNAREPFQTIQQLVAYAKANPGKLNYGSAIGIGPHFIAELFKRKAGVDIVHVPYRGGAPMITDLLADQVQMTVNGKSVLMPHIAAGKLRALAVSSPERWKELPDVPTLVEAGYMDAPYDTLFGVVTPRGTPAPIVDKLNAVINEGLRSPEMVASFAKLGIEPKITTPQEFAAVIAEEVPRWKEIVRVTGIRVAK